MKYVLVDSHSVPGADYDVEKSILEAAGFEVVIGSCQTNAEIIEMARDAEGIGVIYSKLDAELLSQLPACKVIVRYGVGYDCVDVAAASALGIAVCNIPDYCRPDVATHTIALLLDLTRKVTYFDRNIRQGNWNENAGYLNHRLSTLTLGLLGFGAIAQLVARYAKGLELTVIACDPMVDDAVFAEAGVKRVSQEQLLAQADIISLHLPLTQSTQHLINATSIGAMKDGVMIINTARGQIINLDDLIAGLNSGKVTAAALDVLDGETITDPNHPMWQCDSLVLTPHSAYYSAESGVEQHEKVAEAVITVVANGFLPENCVNRSNLTIHN